MRNCTHFILIIDENVIILKYFYKIMFKKVNYIKYLMWFSYSLGDVNN